MDNGWSEESVRPVFLTTIDPCAYIFDTMKDISPCFTRNLSTDLAESLSVAQVDCCADNQSGRLQRKCREGAGN